MLKVVQIPEDEQIFLDDTKYTLPADFVVYDDKIAFMSADFGGYTIIIEHQKIAETMKEIFDLAYKELQDNNSNLPSK